MPIASTVEEYLEEHGIRYEVIKHPRSVSSSRIAEAAHVPGDRVAKSVLLADESGYVVAVLPSTHRLDLEQLCGKIARNVNFAGEQTITQIFADCDPGAVPPLGPAYNVETIVDDSLLTEPEIYFEAGDHEALVRVSGEEFRALMADRPHGQFSFRA
jgi:Ala-tRNA(Pro) deacylase